MSKNLFSDLRSNLPNYDARVIFDVGANVGQTTKEIIRSYPEARVFAFEPVKATFDVLEETHGQRANVQLFNLALGAEDSVAVMRAAPGSVTNKIIPEDSKAKTREQVTVQRGDHFVTRVGVDAIQILKIDTEGYDLNVILGFHRMIGEGRIDFIQVESTMNPFNDLHVPARDFFGYLEPLGYTLFGIYDQTRETRGVPRLRRMNLAFISKKCVEQNTPPAGSV